MDESNLRNRKGYPLAWEALREEVKEEAVRSLAEAEASFLSRRRWQQEGPADDYDVREFFTDPPLFPEHDGSLFPRGHAADVAAALPEALERERRFDARWWRHFQLKFWRTNEPWWFDDLRVTPASFSEAYNINQPVSEFIGDRPWPNGVPAEAGMVAVCRGYFGLVWEMKFSTAMKALVYSCLASLVPPLNYFIFGSLLIDELNTDTSIGQSYDERFRNAILFALSILVLRALELWCAWVYEFEIPGVALRYYTRGNMYRILRNLKGPLAEKFASPSYIASFLTLDLEAAVENVWERTLLLPSVTLGFVVTLGVSLVGINFDPLATTLSMVLLVSTFSFAPLLYFWYKPKWTPITQLYFQWYTRVFALYATATPNPYSDGKANVYDGPLNDIFGKTSFVYLWRHFHNYMAGLSMEKTLQLLFYIVLTVIYVLGAREVLQRHITVGNFTTLSACTLNLLSLAEQLGSYFRGLQNGYFGITRMAEVINTFAEQQSEEEFDEADPEDTSKTNGNGGVEQATDSAQRQENRIAP